MPIKAAEYTVGFDTQQAKANWAALEEALQNGSDGAKAAFDSMRESFNQVTNVHRTGKKDVDAFLQLIKDEKQETRTMGFLMRNASESVTSLSETFGGPAGLGEMVGSAYSRFDELNFALEGLATVGEKAGGSFAKMAGVIGGIAVPAGLGLAAFSLIKEEFEKDSEKIKGLEEQIRALRISLGQINTTKLHELNLELLKLSEKKPDVSFFTELSQVVPGVYGYLPGVAAGLLEIEKQKLEVMKAQREERERMRALEMTTIGESMGEWQSLYALRTAQLAYEQSNLPKTTQSMQQQSDLLKAQIASGNEYLLQLIARGAPLKDTLALETTLMQLLKQRKDLDYEISNKAADDEVRSSAGYQSSLKFLRDAQKEYKALHAMEDRNAPKRIISQVVVSEGIIGAQEALRQIKDDYNAFAVQGGDIIAQSLNSGFTRGFASGKLMLSDFTSAMMASILQIAAQEAAVDIGSLLISLIPGAGPFASIASALGSHFFKGGSGSGSGGKGSGFDPKGRTISSGSAGSLGSASIGDLHTVMQQVVTETRMVRQQIRQSRPAVYVGGVTTPDAIVSENIGVAERRRARRVK